MAENVGLGAVSGPKFETLTAVSANYTVLPTDSFIQVTTGTSVIVVTLPAPVAVGSFNAATMRPDQSTAGQLGNVGETVYIQKVDTGNGTVTISGNMNIGASYGLANRWSSVTLRSDGTRWNLIGSVS